MEIFLKSDIYFRNSITDVLLGRFQIRYQYQNTIKTEI